MNVQVIEVQSDSADLRRMIAKLDEDLLTRYRPEDIHGLDFDDPNVHRITLMVAYADDEPVGCGAIRPLGGETTELKRFFVEASVRRQGIAGRMLEALERKARETGFAVIRLETGTEQPEAIRFYEKNGYAAIAKYGEYADSEHSLCYEKSL
ncbi:GNAT family N-acetyltransferase [Cohnella nanjingensis]|uniref:GNAT family N-acetyltransferase n=1 Tax=Cohnella nanjingensis TaxID=1387779 RepID=A0A7X0RR98_9BACL|nr:GNAT family N-acetyltransferase [Cohnella nanjingensis]MBB6672081.1 GNAT family N-acetyltransferase [Cohnella nanjingensis]